MPRPAARPAALLLTLGLLVPSLAACGSDDGDSGGDGGSSGSSAAGLGAVEVSGEVGETVEVEWSGEMSVEDTETEVLEEGEGQEVAAGDSILAHIYVGNGATQEEAISTFEADQPQLVTVDPEQFLPGIADAVEGVTVGSRVAVAATPADAFGETGNPQVGIGNADPVLFVVDVLSEVLEEPQGEEVTPESPVPTLATGEDGGVTGMTFPPAVRPTDELVVSYLVRGDGAEVTADSTVAAHYLGQVLGAKKPFDSSYSRGAPTAFPLSGVVKGWTEGLTGVPVGSRVILQIPPALGYGAKGNPQAGIKGTDTIVFVIDVLGATDTK